jgi:hypothetical protein
MFIFDLFSSRVTSASSSPSRWDGQSGKSFDGDIGMERFTSMPGDAPAELSAAGITTSDLSAS